MNATLNGTGPAQMPSWLPSGFQVIHDVKTCVTPRRQLTSFAMYNCIDIGVFLLTSNTITSPIKWLTKKGRARKLAHEKWSFWSAMTTLSIQIISMLLTGYLIQRSGYRAGLWDLVQLWALRPRVSWLVGNFAKTRKDWGYTNGALSSIFAEVFICGLATVFLGRTLQAAFTHQPSPETITWTWYVIVVASSFMLAMTGVEMIWALWMLRRILEQGGRAEAQDVNSLLWIVRVVVPGTATCSWLVWISFLYASKGSYCPGTIKWVDLVWGLAPLVEVVCAIFTQAFSK